MKTFNLAITSNIINESLTLPKNKAKPVCSNKDCAANRLFGQKKYNYLLDDDDDNKKATPSSSPTNASNTMQCCCSALAPIENKTQIKMNRRNSPAKTPNKIGKDKKSITTENIVGLAMTKCSLETLENSISLKSQLDTNAQVTLHTQSPCTSKQHDKSLTKGNHLMKKTLVVEKLKSTNSVIARKLFSSTKRAIIPHSNNSIDKHKETPKTPDSTDLDDDDTTTTTTKNTNTTTTTATVTTSHKDNDNDKVKEEESQSMITSLLRTTTL
uniref:Uncharacterized protein n=1 Tax=Zeugodacus cucurbitae TaxID=28588 RepID=A0A0A1WLV8_ZEUCU